jgi:hypothetical protein
VVGLNGAARVMTCAEVLRHAVLDAVEVRVVAGEDGVMKSGLRIGVWAEYVVGLGRWFGGFAPPPRIHGLPEQLRLVLRLATESGRLPKAGNWGNSVKRFVFSLPEPLITSQRPVSPASPSPQKSVIEQAFEFQQLLDDRVVNNRAEIAERYGISRARVTQVLNVLRLSQSALRLLEKVVADHRFTYTERRPRPILRLPTEAAQLAAIQRLRDSGGKDSKFSDGSSTATV